MYNDPKIEKKYQEDLRETILFLNHFAKLIAYKKFDKWFNRTESRFEWANEAVFEKIKEDCMFQVKSLFYRHEREDLSDLALMKMLATKALEEAEKLGRRCNLKISAGDKALVPRGSKFTEDLIYEKFSISMSDSWCRENFYLWNAIGAFILYVRGRDTLERETPNKYFEKLLESRDSKRMSQGHPNDILAHDAHSIRTRKDVAAIAVEEEGDHCSSNIFFGNQLDGVKIPDSKKVYRMM